MTIALVDAPRETLTACTAPSGRPAPDYQTFACTGAHPRWPSRRCGKALVTLDIARPTGARQPCQRCARETVITVTEAMVWPTR